MPNWSISGWVFLFIYNAERLTIVISVDNLKLMVYSIDIET